MNLDKTDRAILMAIQADARETNANLAERIGLTETPCARRVKRLEAEGYIEGYRGVLSKRALGIGVTAFALVRFGVHDRKAGNVSFKCQPSRFLELTDVPGIIPAPYLARHV